MSGKSLLTTSVGHGYNDMYFYLFPLLLPLFRMEFNLNYAQVGLIMTIFMATIAIFTSVWGSLGDRFSPNRLLAFGFALASCGLLAVTLPSQYALIIVMIAVTGIGVSVFHPLATAMISFSSRRPGLSMGVFEGSGTVGGILATVVMSLLISSWGWRWPVVLLALPGFWLAYVFFRKTATVKEPANEHPASRPTTLRILLLFFAGRTVRGLAAGAALSFLPSYIIETWRLSPSVGSIVYASFYIGGLIGALCLGYLADRVSHIGLAAVATLMPVLLIFLMTQNIALPFGILLLLLIGACSTGFYPPNNRWIAEGITRDQRGRFFGIGMTLETIAVAGAPGIFGLLADQAGLIVALRSTTVVWLIAGAIFAFIMFKEKSSVARKIVE